MKANRKHKGTLTACKPTPRPSRKRYSNDANPFKDPRQRRFGKLHVYYIEPITSEK
jgi:hypothetical protein